MKSTDVKIGGGGSLGKNNAKKRNVHRARCGSTGFRIYRYGLCVGFAILLFTASASAETIVYPDDGTKLQSVYSTGTGSQDLAPEGQYNRGGAFNHDGWSDSLNGNEITVTSNAAVPIDHIFGAYYTKSYENGDFTANGNTITIEGGTVNGMIAAGYLNTYFVQDDLTGTVDGNTIIIGDGEFTGTGNPIGIYAGHSHMFSDGNSQSTAVNNTVTIDGGTFAVSPMGFGLVDVRGGFASAQGKPQTDGFSARRGDRRGYDCRELHGEVFAGRVGESIGRRYNDW